MTIEDERARRQCAAAVTTLLARHGWRLLDPEDFTQRTLALLRAGTLTEPQRAATHAYCLALYAACSGAEGAQRQNTAYGELFRYLHDIARWRAPEISEEVAQVAIERVFERFGSCRVPGAFLFFAIKTLTDSIHTLRQQNQRQPISLALEVGDTTVTLGEHLVDERQPDPSDTVMAAELRTRLAHCFDDFVVRHPRARKQVEVLRLQYVDDLDDVAIGERLQTTVKNVYVLRSRAIQHLANDPAWRAVAKDYGLLADDGSEAG